MTSSTSVAAPLPLNDRALQQHAGRVALPAYDRRALVPAVVHMGVGGFHRAHQALYLDDLAATGETGWGVVGVSLRRPEMGEVLRAQDGLYTVVERGADGDRARVVGSVLRHLYAPEDPEAVLAVLSDPRTRLVTLTITGDGYLTGADGGASAPGVVHDLRRPQAPRGVFGFLVEALARRRAAGLRPFTVLSCDNLPDSGAAARTAVLSSAGLRDPGLAAWIGREGSFPSSMVDRITPETTPETRDEVVARFGVADRWPVVTEPFSQWVVEDAFCAGRPPLDRVGVQFVDDVAPYELVKARLLNGGHCALGHVGALAGHVRTDAAMADPVVAGLLRAVLVREVAPLLPVPDGLDLADYTATTLERFANPAVGDTLARLCRRSSTKMPTYLLPSLAEARRNGRPCRLLALVVAAWMRYLQGSDLAGRPVEVEDVRAEALRALALRGGDDPRLLLGVRSVFGTLGDDAELVADLRDALTTLRRDGLAAAVRSRTALDDLETAA